MTTTADKATGRFHREALVIDLHTDSLILAHTLGKDLSKRHRAPDGFQPWLLHADVPRLKESGVDAVFLGIVTHPWPRGAFERAVANLRYGRRVIEKNRADLALATDPAGITSARETGKIAVLFGVEGMHMLSGDVERIEALYALGARYITMAHFTSNRFAVSSADPIRRRAGMTLNAGRAIDAMNGLGMMIDLAHTHTDIIHEVCRSSRQPVIVSHGACQALRPTFRNLSDRDIADVARTGGVIGLIYASEWLACHGAIPTLGTIVDHADHIRRVAGIDHVALGSDWDGFIAMPEGMRDVTDLVNLTQTFFDRGYSAGDTEKVLGLNFMRVFNEVSGGGTAPIR